MTGGKAKPKTKDPSAARGMKSALVAKNPAAKKSGPSTGKPGARLAKGRGDNQQDWRAETLEAVRRIILKADPEIVEERKWIKPTNPAGVPVWSHEGIICTGETYREVVKLTFFKGAALKDPHKLFNAGLDGGTRRAIDIRQGESVDPKALADLIHAAVAENLGSSPPSSRTAPQAASESRLPAKKTKSAAKKPNPGKLQPNEDGIVLLSGGNPQIAKGDGNAPVQAYIAAMPGWKRSLGKRLDEIIMRSAPGVTKGVRWNSPFYGMEGQGWFVSYHVFTKYVKVTFLMGASLRPLPPGSGKDKNARWIDIYEADKLDEAQFADWVKQASSIPGWIP